MLKSLENNHKWIVYYKHNFIIAIIFFYHQPFLDLFCISSHLNDIKYQLCYLKGCLYTQKLYLFIVTSCSFFFFFFYYYYCLFFFCVFVENCILLPKGINEFVVFMRIVHVWFWFFTLLPRFVLVVIKVQYASQNKIFPLECIFSVTKM